MAEETRVGDVLLKKDDLETTLNTKRGAFVLRLADPLVRRNLIRNIATALGHAPLESVPASDYLYVKAMETLRLVVVSAPDWWEGIDRCRDDDLIMELYNGYLEMEDKFRRLLRGNGAKVRGKEARPT